MNNCWRKLAIEVGLIGILALELGFQVVQGGEDTLDLSAMMQPADPKQFIHDDQYFNWCHSIVRDSAGRYQLFYARWPKSLTFNAWSTHSEIAHAISDHLTGPYTGSKTILRGRGEGWDAITAHNVQVNRFGDRYYMYYIGTNSGDKRLTEEQLQNIAQKGYSHPQWDLLRSRQRVGVAVADSLNARWQRSKHPLIEPGGAIKTITTNPSVCQGRDNRFYLIVKGDDVRVKKGRRLIQAISVSEKPDGDFKIEPQPAFSDISTEDVCIWFDKERDRYYALFHAFGRDVIGMITSEDGIHWQKARHFQVCKKEIPLCDGTVMKIDRMERPYVYLENDQIRMVSFAVKKANDSFIVLFECKSAK